MLVEELIKLRVNSAAHTMFQAMIALQFWAKQLVAYPNLAKAAEHSIMQFSTISLGESALDIKTKTRM